MGPEKKPAAQKAICVLGMHRSGTSTIIRAINLLGAYIGEADELGGPAEDNPEGFWERWDINILDERILALYKRSWDTVLPQPQGWHKSEEVQPLKDEAKALVKKYFSDKSLWAWKDPRTTLLFELWKDVVSETGADLSCLFAVRNPLDVARSLEKRNGFNLDRSFGIWFNYNIAAVRASAELRRSFVSYDSFLSNWEKELKRCARELEIAWPEDDSALRKEMDRFIKPGLRHSSSGMKELKAAGAPGPVLRLYELLDGAASLAITPDEEFSRELDELAYHFNSYARFFKNDIEGLWDSRKLMRQLMKSWSWKTTAPFRAFKNVFKR